MGTILPFREQPAETPGWLLLRMYDTALAAMESAGQRMRVQDYQGKGYYISQAISIFYELTCSLRDREDNLARNLDSLYLLCTAKLARASLNMDPAPLEDAHAMITRIRKAVAEAIPSMPKDGRRARVLPFTKKDDTVA